MWKTWVTVQWKRKKLEFQEVWVSVGVAGSHSNVPHRADWAFQLEDLANMCNTIIYLDNKYWFFRRYAGSKADALHPSTLLFESLNLYRLCPHQLAGSSLLLHLLLKPKASQAGSTQAGLLACNNSSVTAATQYHIPALVLTYVIFLLRKRGRRS